MRSATLGCSLVLFAVSTYAGAQNFSTSPCNENGGGGSSWWSHDEHACEIRRATFPLNGSNLGVTGKNGNIEVIGEDRSDIALEAKVTAQGSSRGEAESLLHEIKVVTGNDIHAEGPNQTGWSHRGWSVDFKLRVPHRVEAELRTSNGNINAANLQGHLNASSSNGNITLDHIGGEVRATSTNGGLRLQDLAGGVHAETTNGGVDISLASNQWRGNGLFAKSTNGSVSLKAPDHFAAHLVAQTTNGGISVGFPISVQGKIGRSIDTELNGGGPPVHLETTNGGISINRM